ncbi:hypothetical protein SUGI_1228590 [Cryptomeria japonica]|uniref:Uncharacterized protein n=1 Tax=Cryptomeria japonica TaxID=3369 RepID=A0AAD3NQ56_CRYJA|nr:hypothetical protein SUGI_1228590 [Cryptomeria japonica]
MSGCITRLMTNGTFALSTGQAEPPFISSGRDPFSRGPYFLLLPFLRVGGTITISTLHRGWEAPAGIGSDDSKSLSDSIRNMPATKRSRSELTPDEPVDYSLTHKPPSLVCIAERGGSRARSIPEPIHWGVGETRKMVQPPTEPIPQQAPEYASINRGRGRVRFNLRPGRSGWVGPAQFYGG